MSDLRKQLRSHPSLRLLWYILLRLAGSHTSSITQSSILRYDLSATFQELVSKDTLSLHIWCVFLRGASVLFLRSAEMLLADIHRCLGDLREARKKQLCLRQSLMASGASAKGVRHSYLGTPLLMSVYVLSESEEVARKKYALKAENLDLFESKDHRRVNGSLHSDSFGPQNDFELVLNSMLPSVRASLAGRDVNVDLGNIELIVPQGNAVVVNGNASTVKKKKKRIVDKTCCITDLAMQNCLAESRDIVTWRMQGPPSPRSLIFNSLLAALQSVLKSEDPLSPGPEIHTDLQVVKQEEAESSQLRDSFLAIDEDFLLLPEPKFEGGEPLIDFETPKIEVTPPLADILLPTNGEFSFEDAQRDNPNMKPASLFLKLLELVKAGEVELEQNCEFAPLRIRQRLGV